MTIFTHPTCTIALHHIFFSFVTPERAPKPPSTKALNGRALYNASKHRLAPSIHVGRANVRWGILGRKGKKKKKRERQERSIDRAAALLAKVWDVLYS